MSHYQRLVALLGLSLLLILASCNGQSGGPLPSPSPTSVAKVNPTSFPATATPMPPAATATTRPAPSATVPAPTTAPTTRPTAAPAVATATLPQPTTAAGAGKIVFQTGPRDKPEIAIMNPDGSGRRKVADGRSPIFSADGQRIAFLAVVSAASQTNPLGKVAIRSVKLDGSDPQDLCLSDANAQLDLVAWSPDGNTVMMDGGQAPPSIVFACDVASHNLAPAFATTPQRAYQAWAWTPDGKHAVWQTGPLSGDLNMVYGDPAQNGANATPVTTGQNRLDLGPLQLYSAARVSPDGKTLALAGSNVSFVNMPGQQSPLQGKTVDAYAGLQRNFFTSDRLAWSPDGKSLLVTSGQTIKLVDVATGTVKTLMQDGGPADWSHQ